MKTAFFVSVFLVSFAANGQKDTVRMYYQNGNVYSEHPQVNGKTVGTIRTWHLDGTLMTEQVVSPKGVFTSFKRYHANGNLAYSSRFKNGKQTHSFQYNEDGVLFIAETYLKDGRRTESFWFSGKLKAREEYVHGYPIGCVLWNDQGVPRESCYCWNRQVYWTGSLYVYADSTPANPNYRYDKINVYNRPAGGRVTFVLDADDRRLRADGRPRRLERLHRGLGARLLALAHTCEALVEAAEDLAHGAGAQPRQAQRSPSGSRSAGDHVAPRPATVARMLPVAGSIATSAACSSRATTPTASGPARRSTRSRPRQARSTA